MTTNAIWWPITEQAEAIRTRRISAVELAGEYSRRIADIDPTIQSYVATNPDLLKQAAEVDDAIARGCDPGPLAGVCIAIKDNYLTADMPTRAGTGVEQLTFGQKDSHAVARLRAAGAILPGKVRMHEFAWGNVTHPARNPWNTAYVPGGSSGGSGAAVAAGLCAAAMGSDTGGSIRIPAAACGTVGIKPTYGLIGRSGIVPHSWSLDHAGPLTRTVADAALLLNVLAGPDADDPVAAVRAPEDYMRELGTSLRGRRIGILRNHFTERVHEDVRAAFKASIDFFRREGAEIREYDVPLLEYGLGAIFAIELASSSAYHEQAVRDGLTAGFTDDVRDLVEMGRLVSSVDYMHAEQVRSLMMADFARIFTEVDVVATPSMPITAWKSGEWTVDIDGTPESVLAASWRFTYPFNLVGLPAISVPNGFDRAGLPTGLQIAGPAYADARVLNVAHLYERVHDWHARQPLDPA